MGAGGGASIFIAAWGCDMVFGPSWTPTERPIAYFTEKETLSLLKDAGFAVTPAKLKAWLAAHGGFVRPKDKNGKPVFEDDALLRLKVLARLYTKGHSEGFIRELLTHSKPGQALFDAVLGGAAPAPAPVRAAPAAHDETSLALSQALLLLADIHEKLSRPAPPPPPAGVGHKDIKALENHLDDLLKVIGQHLEQHLHQLRTQRHESRVVLESVDGRLEVVDKRLREFLRTADTAQEDQRAMLEDAVHSLAGLKGQVATLEEAQNQAKEMHHRMVSETRNLLRSLEETDPAERRNWIRGLKK